jgi:hypothetical protein
MFFVRSKSERLFFVPACLSAIAARSRQGFWPGMAGLRGSMVSSSHASERPCHAVGRKSRREHGDTLLAG